MQHLRRAVVAALVVPFVVAVGGACLRENPDFSSGAPPATAGGPGVADLGPADAGVSAHPDLAIGPSAPDLAPDPGDPGDPGEPHGGVSCGTQTCAAPTYCCLGPLGAPSCVAPNPLACVGGKRVTCDGPEDCGGGACCATLDGTLCAPACLPAQPVLCHDDGDCPDAGRCCPGTAGYGVCSKHDC